MTVRSLDPLDLPLILKYHRQVVMLDSVRQFTSDPPFSLKALLVSLNPQRDSFSLISREKERVLLGQVTRQNGSARASLGFLAPEVEDANLLTSMLEQMLVKAGEWGCQSLVAEVDEESATFRSLRQTGMSMYAWQRVWKLDPKSLSGQDGCWQPAESADLPGILSLYNQIVPAMLQSVEPPPREPAGLVLRNHDDLQAYMALTYGPRGIFIQPLIHPEMDCQPGWLPGIAERKNRPVYLCVRSYQAWLESMLNDLGAEPGERQAVLIRHLAQRQRLQEALPVKKREPAWAKPATPLTRIHPTDSDR